MTILQAHITEHVGFMARAIVQQEMEPEMQKIMQETGGQLTPEQQLQLQQRTASGVAIRIAEIIEQMVAEEQQMMDTASTDPLVDLKQQEIDLRKEDLEQAQEFQRKQMAMQLANSLLMGQQQVSGTLANTMLQTSPFGR